MLNQQRNGWTTEAGVMTAATYGDVCDALADTDHDALAGLTRA